MAMKFKEIARIELNETDSIVLSEAQDRGVTKGFSISKFTKTEKFTGFTKAIYVPEEKLAEFLKMFPAGDLEAASAMKSKQ